MQRPALLGAAALSETDKIFLQFADQFEDRFIRQGAHEDRSIEETLKIGWDLLAMLPRSELKRVKDEYIERYMPVKEQKESVASAA